MNRNRLLGAAAIACLGAWSTAAGAQADSDGAIHLHMPGQAIHLHPIRPREPRQATPAETGASAPAAPQPVQSAPPSQETPAATSKAKNRASKRPAIPFNFGDDETIPSAGSAAPSRAAPPTPSAALPLSSAPAQRSAAQTGLTKRGAVLFAKGAPDPSPAQFDGVKVLAGDIAGDLEAGGARVELDAYGGAPGDKSSDARRLSLRRALAVRQLLIDDGVPSSRIDVRALGGAEDKGPSDRVDVFVRAG